MRRSSCFSCKKIKSFLRHQKKPLETFLWVSLAGILSLEPFFLNDHLDFDSKDSSHLNSILSLLPLAKVLSVSFTILLCMSIERKTKKEDWRIFARVNCILFGQIAISFLISGVYSSITEAIKMPTVMIIEGFFEFFLALFVARDSALITKYALVIFNCMLVVLVLVSWEYSIEGFLVIQVLLVWTFFFFLRMANEAPRKARELKSLNTQGMPINSEPGTYRSVASYEKVTEKSLASEKENFNRILLMEIKKEKKQEQLLQKSLDPILEVPSFKNSDDKKPFLTDSVEMGSIENSLKKEEREVFSASSKAKLKRHQTQPAYFPKFISKKTSEVSSNEPNSKTSKKTRRFNSRAQLSYKEAFWLTCQLIPLPCFIFLLRDKNHSKSRSSSSARKQKEIDLKFFNGSLAELIKKDPNSDLTLREVAKWIKEANLILVSEVPEESKPFDLDELLSYDKLVNGNLCFPLKLIRENGDSFYELFVNGLEIGTSKIMMFVQIVIPHDQSERMKEIRDSILNGLSHEFKTPVNTILFAFQTLMNEEINFSESFLEDAIRPAYAASKLLVYMIEGLNIYTHTLSRGVTLPTHHTTVNLKKLLEKTMGLFKHKSNVDIRLVIHPELPSEWVTDKKIFRHLLIELCSNAIKFTSQGFITVSCELLTELNKIRISVQDTGTGMDAEELERLKRYFTTNYTTQKISTSSSGIGLGTAIIRKCLVTLNFGEGSIKINSKKDFGSTFEVCIVNAKERLGESRIHAQRGGLNDQSNFTPLRSNHEAESSLEVDFGTKKAGDQNRSNVSNFLKIEELDSGVTPVYRSMRNLLKIPEETFQVIANESSLVGGESRKKIKTKSKTDDSDCEDISEEFDSGNPMPSLPVFRPVRLKKINPFRIEEGNKRKALRSSENDEERKFSRHCRSDNERHELNMAAERGQSLNVYRLKDGSSDNGMATDKERIKIKEATKNITEINYSDPGQWSLSPLNFSKMDQINSKLSVSRQSIDLSQLSHDLTPTRHKKCSCSDILVVDDDMMNRKILKQALSKVSPEFPTQEAINGKEAYDAFQRKSCCSCQDSCMKFRVIFMDVNVRPFSLFFLVLSRCQ